MNRPPASSDEAHRCSICAYPDYETIKKTFYGRRVQQQHQQQQQPHPANWTSSCGCVVSAPRRQSRKESFAGATRTTRSCPCCDVGPSASGFYATYRVEDFTGSVLRSANEDQQQQRSSSKNVSKSSRRRCQCDLCVPKYRRPKLCDCTGTGTVRKLVTTVKSIDCDQCDGKSAALRNAAIAENVLEYEISALEYGIAVVEGATGLFEPKYENVPRSSDVTGDVIKYANVDEIVGDRLGPEGENTEDEVRYENVPSSLGCGAKCHGRKALSASANNLSSSNAGGEFYSNTHSGTFPLYPQKEIRGVVKCAASENLSKLIVNQNHNRPPFDHKKTYDVAKKEMCEIKRQRFLLAQDEYKHLNSALTALATSRTSLCSSGSSGSARYDPELLRSDVALARTRVDRLRKELQQVRVELSCTRQGVETLHSVEQKISNQQGCFNITEAQAVMTELRNIQKSLHSGEKEKAELMQSLVKLKDDLTRLQLGDISPEISTLSLPQEKLSTASQTDLFNDLPIGTRLAEITKMRLKYDESRKKIQQIQQQLADLEDKVQPGQAESDKDRLLLFQEKEQLLRELRSITPRTRSKQEMCNIELECKRLEQDLKNATEMSNRCIADRVRLHEEKQLLLQQLKDALRSMTSLESQLKSLSASTLSVSSSSSLGSLSTTSSKGSLSSGLSFTDIYGGPQCITVPLNMDKPIDMVDLHRRVERLLRGSSSGSGLAVGSGSQPSLSPRSSLSSVAPSLSPPVSPPTAPPPSYDLLSRSLHPQLMERNHLEEQLAECLRLKFGESRQDPPLSPISEAPVPFTLEQEELLQSTSGALSGTPISSGINSRSVSAAVSDESVAGDSGVFEASSRHKELKLTVPTDSTAQVQIKLQYSIEDQTLFVGIQKLRNLHVLSLKEDDSLYIRALALPAVREAGAQLPLPLRLPLPLPAASIKSQTIRLQACRRQHCLGLVQVSLADYSYDSVTVKWYNILSLQGAERIELDNVVPLPCREESSDDSTLISSQTSTLTRNQGNKPTPLPISVESPKSSDDEEEDDDEEDDNFACETDENLLMYHQILEDKYFLKEDGSSDDVPQVINEDQELEIAPPICMVEKETNTECNFLPEGGSKRRIALTPCDDKLSIKRSQTFSPTPQFGKSQYICRLNRSESDSSMPLYRRAACIGAPFDRHAVTRRSLRRGRVPGLPGSNLSSRASGGRSSHAPRTSLDLELDLRAQHLRLDAQRQEIAGLRGLKQMLEAACEKGDSSMVSWVAEDQAFVQLCEDTLLSSTNPNCANERAERRAARAFQRTCRDLYRLRRTRAPRGKPDIITFKEKMAFFTHYHPTIPVISVEDDDTFVQHSTEAFKQNEPLGDFSEMLSTLGDGETSNSIDYLENLPEDLKRRLEYDDTLSDSDALKEDDIDRSDISDTDGGPSDIQVGYRMRRSGRCKNVVEKSQMVEKTCSFDGISSKLDDNLVLKTDNPNCLRLLTERGNNLLKSVNDNIENISETVDELLSVVKNSEDETVDDDSNSETPNARYQYVVDRVLGVQV